MISKLFDIQNGNIVPTEHCYTIKWLKVIMDNYSDNEEYLKVYAYLFYMTYPNPELNPYFNLVDSEKEETILDDIDADFSPEDPEIFGAVDKCREMFSTPTSRAYEGIKGMLDRLALHMKHTQITSGKDSNISQLVQAASKFDQIRQSYKGAFKDLKDELNVHTRGGKQSAYDEGDY